MSDYSSAFLLACLYKTGEGAVVGFFNVNREKTGRYLLALAVMGDALAAFTPAFTVIGAGTIYFVGFERAF
jgi:hypothetical protein